MKTTKLRNSRPKIRNPQNLARVAGVYLAPVPTSVASERLFSVAGEVISVHRSALLPDNASKLSSLNTIRN